MRAHVFIPCLVDQFRPETGQATVRLLEALGVRVDYTPEQVCCGQPFFKSGYLEQCRQLARKTILNFRDNRPVIAPSGSCVRMIREHYKDLFRDDPFWAKRARNLSERVYELSEFLVRVLGVTDCGSNFSGKITFHDSCQVKRGLGIYQEPRTLLGNVPGLELVEMRRSDECCGFGGIFSAKYPHLAEAIALDKIESALATGAEIISGCEISCLIHLEGYARKTGARIRTVHLADILANGMV
jgi:L-lactate dehydrogenase complex protein LldE